MGQLSIETARSSSVRACRRGAVEGFRERRVAGAGDLAHATGPQEDALEAAAGRGADDTPERGGHADGSRANAASPGMDEHLFVDRLGCVDHRSCGKGYKCMLVW